jgi:hypothetical protein
MHESDQTGNPVRSKRKSHYRKGIAIRNKANFLPSLARTNQQGGMVANFNGNPDVERVPV